ncbi:MAG: hypothetical protein U0736_13120 [Gemmataceae bacterium]
MLDRCPHCGVRLPSVVDAFCSECRGPLDEQPAAPDPAPHDPKPLDTQVIQRQSFEVQVYTAGQIAANFSDYLPAIAGAMAVPFVVILIILVHVLEPVFGAKHELIALVGAAAITLGLAGGYGWYLVRRLARCQLYLVSETVVIIGESADGFIEKRCPMEDIKAIQYGESLDTFTKWYGRLHQIGVPHTGLAPAMENLKKGRLAIIDNSGRTQVFHFVDKVFDPESLAEFAAQMTVRGVSWVVASPVTGKR